MTGGSPALGVAGSAKAASISEKFAGPVERPRED